MLSPFKLTIALKFPSQNKRRVDYFTTVYSFKTQRWVFCRCFTWSMNMSSRADNSKVAKIKKNSRGRTWRCPRLTRFYWWPVKWSHISLLWLSNYQPYTLGNLLLNSTHMVRKCGGGVGGEHSKSCHVTMFSTSHSFRRLLGETIRTATISNHVVGNFQDPSFLTFFFFFSLVSSLSITTAMNRDRATSDGFFKQNTYTYKISLIHSQFNNILMLRYVADPQRITAEYRSYAPSHYTRVSFSLSSCRGLPTIEN